jgi:hypothetical protein
MGKMLNYFTVAAVVVMIKMLRLLILLAVFLDILFLMLKIILSRKNAALSTPKNLNVSNKSCNFNIFWRQSKVSKANVWVSRFPFDMLTVIMLRVVMPIVMALVQPLITVMVVFVKHGQCKHRLREVK